MIIKKAEYITSGTINPTFPPITEPPTTPPTLPPTTPVEEVGDGV